jgi:tetrahydromethanopterin S-methyltransferase subunit G
LTPKNAASYHPSYSCSGNTLTIVNAVINPSSESNVIQIRLSQIDGICDSSIDNYSQAIGLVGLILTIILVGAVIGIIFAYNQGLIEFDTREISFGQIAGGVLIVLFTMLIIATLVYITESYCPALS